MVSRRVVIVFRDSIIFAELPCRIHAKMVHFLIGIATVLFVGCAAGAQSMHRASPDNYRRLLEVLRPGDTLMLAAGIYRDGLPVRNLSGELGRPITISGPRHGAARRS